MAKKRELWWVRRVLSRRQIQVLRAIANCECTKAIASRLRLSIKTVEFHRNRIQDKLHVSRYDTAKLVRIAIRAGLVSALVAICAAALPPRHYYFVVKAVLKDSGIESDPSAEVDYATTNYQQRYALALWDYPYLDTNLCFHLWCGRQSGVYTNRAQTTNHEIKVSLCPPGKTNLVIMITTTGTNVSAANSMKGPWYFLNRTSISITNPTLWPVFYRGAGSGSNRVSLTTLRY